MIKNFNYEKATDNLERYITKLSKKVAWKDILAAVGRVQRNNFPDSIYTSKDFFDPKRKRK